MNMENTNRLQFKGASAVVWMLLSVISAGAGAAYFVMGQGAVPRPVLIAGLVVSCLYALGALVCVCCRRSGGTWLLTLTQVLVSVLLLGVSAMAVMDLLADYLPGLSQTVDKARLLAGLEARSGSAPSEESFVFRVAGASALLLAFIHALTSFSALSALKNACKGVYKSGAVGLCGFLSLVLTAAQVWLFSMMSWACTGSQSLTPEAAKLRESSAALTDTFSFGSYTGADRALLVWALSAALSTLMLAFCAFGLAGRINRAKREMAFDPEIPAAREADGWDSIPAAAPAAATAAEAAAAQYVEWDDLLAEIDADEPAAFAEESFEDILEDMQPEEPPRYEMPAALPEPEPQPVFTQPEPEPEPVYDDPDDEFAGVTAAAAGFVPVPIPGTGLMDYGYSEDTII